MTDNTFEVIIIGGGQGGLATSYYLKHNNINHLILEQADQAAFSWREKKWDSFCFVIPNWLIDMPGGNYKDFGIKPDGFILRDDIVKYFEEYIDRHNLPIKYNSRVESAELMENGLWKVKTGKTVFETSNIVVATGFYQKPKLPQFASKISQTIYQVHSSDYKNPSQLKKGGVLVVGTGQSGVQIAEELVNYGLDVHLSVGSTGRVPRTYRGKDSVFWLDQIGFFNKKVGSLEHPKDKFGSNPHVTGTKGGHDLSIHILFKQGVTLYGHFESVLDDGLTLSFKDDLKSLIESNDKFEKQLLMGIDKYIETNNIQVEESNYKPLDDAYNQESILSFNLKEAGINNIIWACGYDRDYSFVKSNQKVVDEMGYPLQEDGVSKINGLYFIGMPWISVMASGIIYKVGKDAKHIVEHISAKISIN